LTNAKRPTEEPPPKSPRYLLLLLLLLLSPFWRSVKNSTVQKTQVKFFKELGRIEV